MRGVLTSTEPAILTRPTGAELQDEQLTWDSVFEVCSQLLDSEVSGIVSPAGSWTIELAGDGVLQVILRDIDVNQIEPARLIVQLIGRGDDPSNPYPPTPGTTSYFTLSHFGISGRSDKGGPGGSKGCAPRGSGTFDQLPLLPVESVLSITAAEVDPG